MRQSALKPLRVVVSLVSFFLILWLFIGLSGKLTHELTRLILFFQFVPSAITLFHFVTAASLGCIFILLLTLVFGRVYCSFFCPLGTLQDLVIRVRSGIRGKKRFRFMRPQRWVQYGLLALTVIPVFFGSLFVLNLLDPYSFAGKIFSDLFRPAVGYANNLVVWILKQFNNYSLYPIDTEIFFTPALIYAAVIFAAIVFLALFKGRWYCNAICPVGTFLGLLSRFSLFRIRIDQDQCSSCGLCAGKCKAGCIDQQSKELDFSRCVACYNCLRACRSNSISYSYAWKKPHHPETDPSRRRFMKQTTAALTTLAGVLVANHLLAQGNAEGKSRRPVPATPPGSLSLQQFTTACTACHLCVTACPTKVLQPSFFEFGFDGPFLPRMDFKSGFCNYDCVACSQVCPTEALRTLTVEQKHVTRIGLSKFTKNLCVVPRFQTDCGACSEHCPTKAIEMVPYLDGLTIPQVNEKICIGCGACEHICPADPGPAISVEPLAVHQIAEKPLKEAPEKPAEKKKEEDFPF